MGMLFVLLWAGVLGTVVSYLCGLGSLGRAWHVGIGVARVTIGWAMVAFLPFPYLVRMALDGWTVYPVSTAVGTLLVGLVVALYQPRPGG